MKETKKFNLRGFGVTLTIELEEGVKFSEHCPGDNDYVLFIENRLLLHLHRVGEITNE